MSSLQTSLQLLRNYFNSGNTRKHEFRKAQLKKLKQSILAHEEDLYAALYADLRKNPEECWVTELGMVIAEINAAIRDLRYWMVPETVSTNLLNMPSSSTVLREPLGVVLIIGPWNYPFQLLINPLVGAIAAGNCVVLKPSEFAPATATVMKKIIEEVFPPQYVLFVPGEGAKLIPEMMNHFTFDHVFYTGSTSVGRLIYKMAAERLVPVTLELGGKSPCIVEADADIKVAARRIAVTKFSNAGQMCVAPDYILVHASVKDKLVEALRKCILQFYGPDPASSYNYGKIINEKQFLRIQEYLKEGTILYGGKTDKSHMYIEPTLVTDVTLNSSVMKEEIFGPVLPLISFSSSDEAIKVIAANPNPLSVYVYTSNKEKEQYWMEAIPAGGACVNNSSWHLTNHHLPFGGRGFSGTGAYHGRYSFETFSHRKALLKTPSWFDPSIKYPPFKGRLGIFKLFIR